MTTALLFNDLKTDEGLRLNAYQDTVGVWTVGWGHTGKEVVHGLVWTLEQCEAALESDVAATENQLDNLMPGWRSLDDIRQDVIVEMAYNIGVHGLLEFNSFLRLLFQGNWVAAAGDLRLTKWARQVGHRAQELADMVLYGRRST